MVTSRLRLVVNQCLSGFTNKQGGDRELTSPDGDNDFELIARIELSHGVQAFRNDFAIAFDGNALADIAQFFNQAGHSQGQWKLANFAIDLEFEHRRILARPGSRQT